MSPDVSMRLEVVGAPETMLAESVSQAPAMDCRGCWFRAAEDACTRKLCGVIGNAGVDYSMHGVT